LGKVPWKSLKQNGHYTNNSFDSLAVLDLKVMQENSRISWAYFGKTKNKNKPF